MLFAGRQQNLSHGLEYLLNQPIVNHMGRHQHDSWIVILLLYQRRSSWRKARASSRPPSRFGKSGWYLKVPALVKKGGVDLRRGYIHELFRVDDIQDLLTFLRDQAAARRRPSPKGRGRSVLFDPMAVDRCPWNPHGCARRPSSDLGGEHLNGSHQRYPLSEGWGESPGVYVISLKKTLTCRRL